MIRYRPSGPDPTRGPTTAMAPKFHKHTRLRGHDYTEGTYFVTLCTHGHAQLFGNMAGAGTEARMELSEAGRIIDACWRAIPLHFPHVELDEMQIMPDHMHAILRLNPSSVGFLRSVQSTQWVDATDLSDATDPGRATAIAGPAVALLRPKGPRKGSLSAIIGAFKSVTTKRIHAATGTDSGRIWQLGYHDRLIRTQGGEHGRIARYIAANPMNWE